MLKRVLNGISRLLSTGAAIIDDPNYRGPVLRIRRLVENKYRGYKFRVTLKNRRPHRFAQADREHANGWIGWFQNRTAFRRYMKRRRANRLLKIARRNLGRMEMA